MKRRPILFENKENCCGCSACAAICPVQAIAMQLDEFGFYYPFVDENLCMLCYKCETLCPQKENLK